jgi:RIO kinase 3
LQLSNPIYNEIRRFNLKETKRKNRLKDKEDKSTVSKAVDPKTRLILFKMVNNGFLETVDGTVASGKEAVILHADGICTTLTPNHHVSTE